jgi:hypothetical protein
MPTLFARIVFSCVSALIFCSVTTAQDWNLKQLTDEAKGMDAAKLDQLRKSAEGGDARSQFLVGLAYEYGYGGIAKDRAEALRWHTKAAEQGVALPEAWVGDFYYEALGVPVDFREAARWYRRSGEHGYGYAAGKMGDIYLFGEGATSDTSEAARWYARAVELGYAGRFSVARDATQSSCQTQFCQVLRQVLATTYDEFSRFQGEQTRKDEDLTKWAVKLWLPGAQECEVELSKYSNDGKQYSCDFGTYPETRAGEVFERVARQIKEFLPPAWSSEKDMRNWGGSYSAGPKDKSTLIFLSLHPSGTAMLGGGNERYVRLTIR